MSIGISILTSLPTDNVHPPCQSCNVRAGYSNAESFRRMRRGEKRVVLPGRGAPVLRPYNAKTEAKEGKGRTESAPTTDPNAGSMPD